VRDELDRILSEEEQILPSSGFVASVMAAVRHQAATSAPIPFPWRRALPGLAAAAVTLVSLLLAAVAQVGRAPTVPPFPAEWLTRLGPILEAATRVRADCMVLALFLSLGSVVLSMRLTGARA
jgi:hypothetical protein